MFFCPFINLLYKFLLTVHVINSQVFPVFYCMAKRKTTESYVALLKFIENNIFNLEPMEFTTDFEAALQKAIKIVYPGVRLNSCWFHYIRAIQRRCTKLGMRKLLRNNFNARTVQKQMSSLPLLPYDCIEEGFNIIKEFAKKMKLATRFQKFFKYYQNYWLKKVLFKYVRFLSLRISILQIFSSDSKTT